MAYYSKKAIIGTKNKLNYIKGLKREDTLSTGSPTASEGVDKIREDILNILDISKREQFFDPEVGSNLERYLFQQNDFVLRDMLYRCIKTDVEDSIPEVTVDDVSIEQTVDTVYISVKYKIISLGVTDTINITKEIRDRMKF